MKKLLIIGLLLIISCKASTKEQSILPQNTQAKLAPITDSILESAVIYEANIRQYSPEGTFKAFTKDIPQLKKLGVKIIWLMPIFPISKTKRKATGDTFVSEYPKAARKKYLGSYYAVSNFTEINPEFGKLEDFRDLIKTAHKNGIYVILDWVPNHTGWDHVWLKEHPEFYTKNEKGEITDPLDDKGKSIGWTDVADLNYANKELHKAMISDMKYWITNEAIDGFRCDVAGSVPLAFWEKAIPTLRKEKNIFMLAEAWEPELLKEGLFDMAYAWEGHHIMNGLAQGKKTTNAWDAYMEKIDTTYQKNAILMNFITNHDENSWNGTVKERMGDASETMLALTYVIPGMPLIYSGQEYGLDHRLKFFEKDSIPKTKGKMWALLEKLGKLKNTHKALYGGKNAASYKRIETDNEHVLIFERHSNGHTLTFVANLSNKEQHFKNVLKGGFLNSMTDVTIEFRDKSVLLKPWNYLIFTND